MMPLFSLFHQSDSGRGRLEKKRHKKEIEEKGHKNRVVRHKKEMKSNHCTVSRWLRLSAKHETSHHTHCTL